MLSLESCPVCGNNLEFMYRDMFDDRYGYPGWFTILACRRCGQLETAPQLCEKELTAVYSKYYPRKCVELPELEKRAAQKNSAMVRFKRWFFGTNNQGHYYATAGMRVLDFGCGDGTSLLELKNMRAEAYGIETDENVKLVGAHFGLRIHFGTLAENPFPDIRFDLITLNQVIEHIPKPCQLLRQFSARLSRGGRIILSFPNTGSLYRRLMGRNWINWHVPYHVHHFCGESFALLCKKAGFKVVSKKTVTPNLWTTLQLRACREINKTTEGTPNRLWVPAYQSQEENAVHLPKQRRKHVFRALKSITSSGLNILFMGAITVVNRVIDSLGLGDSLVVVIEPVASATDS